MNKNVTIFYLIGIYFNMVIILINLLSNKA